MSDTPTPAPAADDNAGEPHKPSPFNTTQITSLTKTEEICRAALLEEYLDHLITKSASGQELTDDDPTAEKSRAVQADCQQVRNYSGEPASATADKELLTDGEIHARDALLVIMHNFQARAPQKHHAKNPSVLENYGVGVKLKASRSLVEQYAQAIWVKTAGDKLPKITEASRTGLQQALVAYKNAQTTPGQRTENRQLGSGQPQRPVGRNRRRADAIQFAADAEWPHTGPANHPIRMQFQLPVSKPFVG